MNFVTHKTKLILTFPNNLKISSLKQIPFGRSLTVGNGQLTTLNIVVIGRLIFLETLFCAILMGDTRKNGMVQPLAFETMRIFELAGFKTKEIIIKEQHNCKATGFWKTNSIKHNFLLLAHEYLFIFRKS